MLGYITIKREELKVKDFDTYRGFYCGVCHDLKKNCGEMARLTLTYDMTFLAILLTSLYEQKMKGKLQYCILHPGQKMLVLQNKYTSYAADMNTIMVYQNLIDDWRDEKNKKSLAKAGLLKSAYIKAKEKYPRQMKAFARYLKALHKAEKEESSDLDLASGLTGEFFKEVYMYDENDVFSKELGEIGFYIGKFIYLMDAYEDVKKDMQNGCYNPFIFYYKERDDFDAFAKDILTMMVTNAAAAFERLPIVDNTEILRNILYAGVWNKYYLLQEKGRTK